MLLLRFLGLLLFRFAQRKFSGLLLFQDPPRRTFLMTSPVKSPLDATPQPQRPFLPGCHCNGFNQMKTVLS
jgi:hypothetical protein